MRVFKQLSVLFLAVLFVIALVCSLSVSPVIAQDVCEGDFDCDGDQDGTDAAVFKIHFGRGEFTNPCETDDPCYGDFDGDGDADGTDAATFKGDFGRGEFTNPCPACDKPNRGAFRGTRRNDYL